jgi:hypothetical protein
MGKHRNRLDFLYELKVHSVHSEDMGTVLHCDETKNGYCFFFHVNDKYEFPFVHCILAISTA